VFYFYEDENEASSHEAMETHLMPTVVIDDDAFEVLSSNSRIIGIYSM
jgi:hypothetical protein